MKTPEKVKLAKLLKERSRYEQIGKPRKEAETCNKIARIHIRNARYKEAIETYKDEMQLWHRQKNSMGEAMCNRSLGECYAEVGVFPMALIHHNQYMSWAESNNNYIELQRALATLGRTFICKAASVDEKGSAEAKASIAKSEDAFLRSMTAIDKYFTGAISETAKPDTIQALSQSLTGQHAPVHHLERSMTVIDKHLTGVVSDSELSQMKARLYLNLGLVYMHQENYTKSIGSIEKAIKISQEHHKMEDLYRGQLSLGDVYLRMNNTSKSLQALDIAFSISKKLKDKEKECDVLVQRAHIHFTLSEFPAAESVLRRVCAIGAIKPAEKPNIIEQIKTAKRCTKLEKKLKTAMEDVNLKKVMEIHEKLGDCCCKVNIYREALLHYNKQLECALTLQLPDEQLSPIYVSLAATYADSQQYGMAVTMYAKELQLREGNSKEECKTWLNVADAQEKAGHSYEALQESYAKATKFAVDAKNPKLQRRVLKSLAVVQERFGQSSHLASTKGKLDKLKIEFNMSSDDDTISEEELQAQAASSDESDQEDFESLVNDPVVKTEPGTAPLEEPESEDILNKWLDTDKEDLPEHTMSEAVIKTEPGLETDTDTASCSFLTENTLPRMDDSSTKIKEEPGSPTTAPHQAEEGWTASSKKGKTLISRPKKRPLSAPMVPEAYPLGPHKRRSQNSLMVQKVQSKSSSTRRKPHHSKSKIVEKFYMGDRNVARKYPDYVTHDECRNSPPRLSRQVYSNNSDIFEAESAIDSFSSPSRHFGRSVSDSSILVGIDRGHPDSSSHSDLAVNEPNTLQQHTQEFTGQTERPPEEEKGVSPDSSLSQGPVIEERMPSIAFVHQPRRSTMRARVTLKGTTYLVNVPLDLGPPATFQWLADRVVARLDTACRSRPKLSLSTTDGALISPEDVVCDTLSANEEVIARLLPSSTPKERSPPVHLKQSEVVASHESYTSMLDTTTVLTRPVSSTILGRCMTSLHDLVTSHCHITDDDTSQLTEAIQMMPHLTKMDLSHNAITYKGLQSLCQTLCPEGQNSNNLAKLQVFILSNNPLTDSSAVPVASFIKNCSQLRDVQLAATELTTQFVMDHHAVLLQTAFEGATELKTFDISHNALGSKGVEILLQFLKPEVLETLKLSSVIEEGTESNVTNLAAYMTHGNCALHSLSLEGCHLGLDDMHKLSKCVPLSQSWSSLNLSSNPSITNQGFLALLEGWVSAGCRVHELDLSKCSLESPLGNEIITHIMRLMTPSTNLPESELTDLNLSNNKLDDSDIELLKAIWVLANRPDCSILKLESINIAVT